MEEKKVQLSFEQGPIRPPSEAYSLLVFLRNKTKRAFDFIVVIMALIFFLPQMAFIALLIRFTMGKPVLFRQYRPGLNGKEFTL
jgi:lipopolysaccharide/colanic/teichoic acid biosynthesis glycosyltransferase